MRKKEMKLSFYIVLYLERDQVLLLEFGVLELLDYHPLPSKEVTYSVINVAIMLLSLTVISFLFYSAIELSDLFIQGKSMTKISSVQDEESYKMLEIIKNDFLERDVDQLNPQELIASVQALFKKKEDS